MIPFLRNMAIVCLGLMLLVGMMTASLLIGLLLLGAGILFWGYFALRRAGIINAPRPKSGRPEESDIIEVDYVVIEEKEQRIPEEKV